MTWIVIFAIRSSASDLTDFSNYEQPEFEEECSAIYKVCAGRRGRLSMLFQGE
jgi:hypothetical protein